MTKKPMSVGVRSALIGLCGLICAAIIGLIKERGGSTTSTVLSSKGENSPVTQIGQSSNANVNNNSGNTTVSIGENTFAAQMNLPVNNNGTMTVINNPIYTSPPDIELRKFVSNINATASFASNGVLLSQAQLAKLTELLTKLDSRTEDVQKLPDGRTSFGGIVGGASVIFGGDRNNAISNFYHGNYELALEYSRKAIADFERCPSNFPNEIVTIVPEAKSTSYYIAGSSAVMLNDNDVAIEYAVKAVNIEPNPRNRLLLAIIMGHFSSLKYSIGDYSNSFNFGWQSITNYEGIKDALSNGFYMPTNELFNIYTFAGISAIRIGRTNEGNTWLDRAHQINPVLYKTAP